MIANYLIAPSMIALFFTGLLLMTIILLFLFNIKYFLKERYFQKIVLLCMMTIALGSHGLIHLGVERQYNFNPYKWF